MDMTLPVTLIVKAPNQQIEDQTVKCELTWTISKLKGHLSEVYPSKPARDEQKLIYSGQLLSDAVVLKDVLRNYDEQNTHTVHLVCTPSRNSSYKFESSSSPKPQQQQPPPEMVSTTHTSVPEQSSSASAASAASNVQTSTTGLRQRATGHNNSSQETMTDFQTMWSTFAQPQANFVVDPTQYAVQMSLFQQAYAQYINQYMQMVTNQVPPIRTDNMDEQEAAAAAAAAPEPINGPELMADEQEDDIQVDRDWLDWFYVFSRVLILFCIVYFYSSPLRFAFVLLLGFGLYLYQMGYFRVQNVNNNEAARRPQENNNVAAAAAAPAHQQHQQQEATNNQNADAVIIEQRPTMLTIMWTFFTTFFASLIPEIPNAV